MNNYSISKLTENQKKRVLLALNSNSHRGNIVWSLDYIFKQFFNDDDDVRGFIEKDDIFLYDPLCVKNVIVFGNILKRFKWVRYHYCLYDPDSEREYNADLFDETGRYFDLYRDVYNIPYMIVEKMRKNGLNKDNKYWISISELRKDTWDAITEYVNKVEQETANDNIKRAKE